MLKRHVIQGSLLLATATGAMLAQAAVIDFETLTGPSTYAAAGARRDLNLGGVSITGGTVLSQETFLPANSSVLYGTAFFGTTTPVNTAASTGGPYLPKVTIDFGSTPITSFYLDVYNGQVFNVTYTLADNAGHSASFALAPNLASGTTQIGFSPVGSVITLTSDAGNLWDFSIDNIHYNEGVPTSVPTTTSPPPPVTNPPPVTLVSVDTPPPPPTLTPEQRQQEGLSEQNRRQKQKGKNGQKVEFRLEAQGFDDRIAPAPVPVPASLPLLGGALVGLARLRRRRA